MTLGLPWASEASFNSARAVPVRDARHGLEGGEVTRRRRGGGRRRRRRRRRRRGAARRRRARTDAAQLGRLLDLAQAVQVVVDAGARAVVEHAVVTGGQAVRGGGGRGGGGGGGRVLGSPQL